MAAPVIIPTQSWLQFLQFQDWELQLTATNSPTSWTCTPVPSGKTFDPAIGLLSGAALKPGFFSLLVTASNSDGTSPALEFAVGIEAASYAGQFDAVDFAWDMASGLVSCSSIFPPITLTNSGKIPPLAPIAWFKTGDLRLGHIRPLKLGAVLDIEFTELKLTLKEFDGDASITLADKFVRVGTGSDTFYRLIVDLTSDGLEGAISDFFSTKGTNFVALSEFQATYVNPDSPAITGAPGSLITSSLNFGVGIQQELTP